MDDLISRQAAIDAIEGVDWYHINKNGEMVHGANDNDHQAWYKAEDIYKAVESVPSAQRWIPCSERLPEPGVYVLVDGADIPGGDRFPLIDKICDDGEWLNCDGSEWSAVAWMPIPEPWKGERDG